MKQLLQEKFISFFEDKDIENITSKIEILKTKDKQFGDYTSNISLKVAKDLGKNPMNVAEEIKEHLLTKYNDDFKEVTVTQPGFVNIFLSKSFLVNKAKEFLDENYKPKFNLKNPLKINYEYVSANPTGDLHIGHLRNAVVGDVTSSLLSYIGHDVTTEYWINDYGNQMVVLATSIFYYYALEKGIDSGLTKKDVSYHGQEIKDFALEMVNMSEEFEGKTNDELLEIFKVKGEVHFFNKIKDLLNNQLKIKEFKYWTSEKEMYESGKVAATVTKLDEKGATFEEGGAKWLRTSEHGDDKDRVLVKSDGLTTYMVADIANHIQKFERGFEYLINLWGGDHHGYEKRILASMEFLGYDSKRVEADFINMVQIEDNGNKVKMSKRAGTSLRIKDMLELMGRDLLKYFIISKSKEQNIVLDISKAKEQNSNNPFYYVQYANARATQLLEKYGKFEVPLDLSQLTGEKEVELLTKIVDYEDAVLNAAEKKEPYMLLIYQRELAQVFNSFYNSSKVIGEEPTLAAQRATLVLITKSVFNRLFILLNIEPIDKM